jgi:hypothetical protein
MPPAAADVAPQIAAVRERIAAAARRAGRAPGDVRLVAVSKTFGADLVRAAAATGQRSFGENRVQEGIEKIQQLEKAADLADLPIEWHLIGHLQSNKARKAAAVFSWIESIDRPDLLRKVDEAARDAGTRPRVLVQVDLAHEATKHGADATAVADLVRAAIAAPGVDLRGLMTVPPFPVVPEDSRPWFRRLRELRDALIADGIPADRLRDLSMGMSQDFEIAIEEGATMVRVGTAIFGRRVPPPPDA